MKSITLAHRLQADYLSRAEQELRGVALSMAAASNYAEALSGDPIYGAKDMAALKSLQDKTGLAIERLTQEIKELTE